MLCGDDKFQQTVAILFCKHYGFMYKMESKFILGSVVQSTWCGQILNSFILVCLGPKQFGATLKLYDVSRKV